MHDAIAINVIFYDIVSEKVFVQLPSMLTADIVK